MLILFQNILTKVFVGARIVGAGTLTYTSHNQTAADFMVQILIVATYGLVEVPLKAIGLLPEEMAGAMGLNLEEYVDAPSFTLDSK